MHNFSVPQSETYDTELVLGGKFQFDAPAGAVYILDLHCFDTYSKTFLKYRFCLGSSCSEDAYFSLTLLESEFQVYHKGYIGSEIILNVVFPQKLEKINL